MVISKAILCVDDERIILTSLRTQITRNFGQDFICELAESAEEALEVIDELSQENIAIIIVVSDWLMPNMKGDEFLIQIHQKHPKIIKILLTGQADRQAIERTHQYADLHCHLPKPWDEQKLIEVLRSGLEKMNE